jgi:hypothetical protein
MSGTAKHVRTSEDAENEVRWEARGRWAELFDAFEQPMDPALQAGVEGTCPCGKGRLRIHDLHDGLFTCVSDTGRVSGDGFAFLTHISRCKDVLVVRAVGALLRCALAENGVRRIPPYWWHCLRIVRRAYVRNSVARGRQHQSKVAELLRDEPDIDDRYCELCEGNRIGWGSHLRRRRYFRRGR